MAVCSSLSDGFHIEILQKTDSLMEDDDVKSLVEEWLKQLPEISNAVYIELDAPLDKHIKSISLSGYNATSGDYLTQYHVYRINSDSPYSQTDDDSGENQQITTQWLLPTEEFCGLWETLIYDFNVKEELLDYVSTALMFSERNVNPNIISWNKVVLLHGPPGTGKTTLCKALAQKLCVRLCSKFTYGYLIEVNAHSLFSKWFSESGKLVAKMFQNIMQVVEDSKAFVAILVDEVESLAHSRKAAFNGTEPSDSVRVVNALLTQLDLIKRYPNVLIMTTSNMTEAIDIALVDRADIKQYIGYPSVRAIYQIYCTCLKELQQTGVIYEHPLHPLEQLEKISGLVDSGLVNSHKLKAIAEKSKGLSGRTLRKLPFIAYSMFIKKSPVSLETFLEGLSKATDKYLEDVALLSNHDYQPAKP